MRIEVHKTHEIDLNYWREIVFEFNRAFNVNKETGELVAFYNCTPVGYSYHALVFEERTNKIIGYNAIYPYKYIDRHEGEILVGVSGGTYVIPEFRKEIFIFADMATALWDFISREGIIATIGVSNENSYQYARQFLDARLISYLPYYALPVRILNVLKLRKISFLNFISLTLAYIHLLANLILSFIINDIEKQSRFELKLDEDFYLKRFGGENYKVICLKNIRAYYRTVLEKGVRTIYLFDFRENRERSYRAIVRSVWYILIHEKPDIIIFIGNLRIKQYLLIRVPWRFEPQNLPLTFNLTSPKFDKYLEPMSDPNNWNFGLMNFDVR
ncbi:MAG: hypothetical protein P1P88_04850 [Bacteroidales bacterium]|nr:hypothetical protein [Bacteroidales bacterium]